MSPDKTYVRCENRGCVHHKDAGKYGASCSRLLLEVDSSGTCKNKMETVKDNE